jgi:hypothetical protein
MYLFFSLTTCSIVITYVGFCVRDTTCNCSDCKCNLWNITLKYIAEQFVKISESAKLMPVMATFGSTHSIKGS